STSVSLFAVFVVSAPASTEIYTLSLHDALPICASRRRPRSSRSRPSSSATRSTTRDRTTRASAFSFCIRSAACFLATSPRCSWRSEEHTSELQSRENLVCRLLLEKKKTNNHYYT